MITFYANSTFDIILVEGVFNVVLSMLFRDNLAEACRTAILILPPLTIRFFLQFGEGAHRAQTPRARVLLPWWTYQRLAVGPRGVPRSG